MNYLDTLSSLVITKHELRARGLSADPTLLLQAGIVPVRYEYPVYDSDLYDMEPRPLVVRDTYALQTFDVAPRPLGLAKSSLLARVDAAKNAARDGGFVVDGVRYDSDLPARTAYAELAIALNADPSLTVQWKASRGAWVTMNAELFQQVHAVGRAHIESCFAWQAAKEAEIDACATVEDLAAVDIRCPPVSQE